MNNRKPIQEERKGKEQWPALLPKKGIGASFKRRIKFYVLLPQLPDELQMVERVAGTRGYGVIRKIGKTKIFKIRPGNSQHMAVYQEDIEIPYNYTFRLYTSKYIGKYTKHYEEDGRNEIRSLHTSLSPVLIYDALLKSKEEDIFLNFILFLYYFIDKELFDCYLKAIDLFMSTYSSDRPYNTGYLTEYWKPIVHLLELRPNIKYNEFQALVMLLGLFPDNSIPQDKLKVPLQAITQTVKKLNGIKVVDNLMNNKHIDIFLKGLALIYSNLPEDRFLEEIQIVLSYVNSKFPGRQKDQLFLTLFLRLCKVNKKYAKNDFAAYCLIQYENNTQLLQDLAVITDSFTDLLNILDSVINSAKMLDQGQFAHIYKEVSIIIDNYLLDLNNTPLDTNFIKKIRCYTDKWPADAIQEVFQKIGENFKYLFDMKENFSITIGLIELYCTCDYMKYLSPHLFRIDQLVTNLLTSDYPQYNSYLSDILDFIQTNHNALIALQSALILVGCPSFSERASHPDPKFIERILNFITNKFLSGKLLKGIENELTNYAINGLSYIYYYLAESYSQEQLDKLQEELKKIIEYFHLHSPDNLQYFLTFFRKWHSSQLLMKTELLDYFLSEFSFDPNVVLALAEISANFEGMVKCFDRYYESSTESVIIRGRNMNNSLTCFLKCKKITLELTLHLMEAINHWDDKLAKVCLTSKGKQFENELEPEKGENYLENMIELMRVYMEYKHMKYLLSEAALFKICQVNAFQDFSSISRYSKNHGTFKVILIIMSYFPDKQNIELNIQLIQEFVNTVNNTRFIENIFSEKNGKEFKTKIIKGIGFLFYSLSYLEPRIQKYIEELKTLITTMKLFLEHFPESVEIFLIELIELWKMRKGLKIPGKLANYILENELHQNSSITLPFAEIATKFKDMIKSLDLSFKYLNRSDSSLNVEIKFPEIIRNYYNKSTEKPTIKTIEIFLRFTRKWNKPLVANVMEASIKHFKATIKEIFYSNNITQLLEYYASYEYMKYLVPYYTYEQFVKQFCYLQKDIPDAFKTLNEKLLKAEINEILLQYITLEIKHFPFKMNLFKKFEKILNNIGKNLDQNYIFGSLIDILYNKTTKFEEYVLYINIFAKSEFPLLITKYVEKYKKYIEKCNLEQKEIHFLYIAIQLRQNPGNKIAIELIDIEEYNFRIDENEIIQHFINKPRQNELYMQIIGHPCQFKLKEQLATEIIRLKMNIENLAISLELGRRYVQLSNGNKRRFIEFLASGINILNTDPAKKLDVLRREVEEVENNLCCEIAKIDENKIVMSKILIQFKELFPNFKEMSNDFNQIYKPAISIIIKDFHPQLLKDFEEVIEMNKNNGNICASNSLAVLLKILNNQEENLELPRTKLICNGISQLKEGINNISENPNTTQIKILTKYFKEAIPNDNNSKTKHEIGILKQTIPNKEGQTNFENSLIHFAQREKYLKHCKIALQFIDLFECNDITEVKSACNFYINSYGNIEELTISEFLEIVSKLRLENKNLGVFQVMNELTKGVLLKKFVLTLDEDDFGAMKQTIYEYDIEAQLLINLESIWIIFQEFFQTNDYLGINLRISNFIEKDPNLDIIPQIQDSINRLPYFKNLKKEMLRKDEADRQTIELIMKNSEIVDTNMSEKWEIFLKFKSEATKEEKKLTIINLGELQDRANLLLATRKSTSQKALDPNDPDREPIDFHLFKSFVEFYEIFSSYINIRTELDKCGYPFFEEQNTQLTYSCINKQYKLFQLRRDKLNKLKVEWNAFIKDCYKKNSSMTHLYGNRFWILEKHITDANFVLSQNLLSFMNKTIRNSQNYNLIESTDAFERLENLSKYLDKLPDVVSNLAIENDVIKAFRMKKGSILYYESTDLIEGIISMFCGQNTIPTSNHILFWTSSTPWQQFMGFLIRCFKSPQPEFFLLILVDSLSNEYQKHFLDLFEELHRIKNPKFKLGILSTELSANSKITQSLKAKAFTHLLKEKSVFTSKQLEETVEFIQKDIFIVTSNLAGLGKSHWISKHVGARKLLNFPLEGTITTEDIGERLLAMDMTENTAVCFQIQLVEEEDILIIIMLQILLFRCLNTPLGVLLIPTQCPVYIEISNCSTQRLSRFRRFAEYFPHYNIEKINLDLLEDSNDLQIVCAHLLAMDEGWLLDGKVTLNQDPSDNFYKPQYPVGIGQCISLINAYYIHNIEDELSFIQINMFIKLLSEALRGFALSAIQFAPELLTTDVEYMNEMIKNIRVTLVQHIVQTVSEFTSKSVRKAKRNQRSAISQEIVENTIENSEIINWGDSNHFYVLFGPAGEFYSIYRNRDQIPEDVRHILVSQIELFEKFEVYKAANLDTKLGIDYNIENLKSGDVTKLKDYSHMSDINLLNELLAILNVNLKEDTKQSLLANYSLVPDNFLKMILIQSRALSQIPIIIMGETGVGKTALIRFLVEKILNEKLEVYSMHAGISSRQIISFIEKVESKAQENKTKTWVFLDEFNTTNSIGLINEMVCHRSILGRKISDLLIFVCACNPYKRKKRRGFHDQNIGLKRKNQNSSKVKLLYTVYPLPETMLNYVWDFGNLEAEAERMHIDIILGGIVEIGKLAEFFSKAVFKAQRYFKEKDPSSVSLRDVQRYKKLYEFFRDHPNPNSIVPERPGILALIHCYFLRISKRKKREEFLDLLDKELKMESRYMLGLYLNERDYYLSNMNLPEGLARNEALSENIFAILVCLVNKIPIFLCGKPGCSKTLSIHLVITNLTGKNSANEFWHKFPELVKIYFQGSLTCTSERINRAFLIAEKYLNNEEDIIPVVVFDEIGLAERSTLNPLKVLHQKLENDDIQVGFIGISNWKLDASKMNRTLYLARPDPDLDDLICTAECIFQSLTTEATRTRKTIEIIHQLAKSYYLLKMDIIGTAFEDHFGLRDFYYLIKMISRAFRQVGDESEESLLPIIKKCFERNFNGNKFVLNNIQNHFIMQRDSQVIYDDLPASSPLDLIKENMEDEHSRYLMIISPGEHGSAILDKYLGRTFPEHKTLFGSPLKENVNQYQGRMLSDIIYHIENGKPTTLKNLEHLYPSLYDLFNQNFALFGVRRRCRIALGEYYNPNCYVHPNYSCIILMDQAQMINGDPDPPFLNRFEKHFLSLNDILDSIQLQIMENLQSWMQNVTTLNDPTLNSRALLTHKNIFLNSSPETLAINIYEGKNMHQIVQECKRNLISMATPDILIFSQLSILSTQEQKEVYDLYRELHQDNLEDILRKATKVNHQQLIIYTFSDSIQKNIFKQRIFKNEIKCKKENIHSINNELTLTEDFVDNFLKSDEQVYLIEVDLSLENKYISYLNHFFEKYSLEIKNSNKTVCIIGLIKRNYLGIEKLSLPYFLNWHQYFLEELSYENPIMQPKSSQLNTTELINDIYKKEIYDFLASSLEKCFKTLKYTDKDKGSIEYRRFMCKNILENEDLIKKLKIRVGLDIAKLDWKVEMISNKEIYFNSTTTYDAFRKSIQYLIQTSLTKIIYTLENESTLNSLFSSVGSNSNADQLRTLIWMDHFNRIQIDPNLNLHSGSETAVISEKADLKFPFSKTEFENIQHLNERCFEENMEIEDIITIFQEESVIGNYYEQFLENKELQMDYFSDLFYLLLQEGYMKTEDICLEFFITFLDLVGYCDQKEDNLPEIFENRLGRYIEYQDSLLSLLNLLTDSSLFLESTAKEFLIKISDSSKIFETIENYSTHFVSELLKLSYPSDKLIKELPSLFHINLLFQRQKEIIEKLIRNRDIIIEKHDIDILDFWIYITSLLNLLENTEPEKLSILGDISKKYKILIEDNININLYMKDSPFLIEIDNYHTNLICTNKLNTLVQEKIHKFNAWKYYSLLKTTENKLDILKSIETENLYKFLGFKLAKYLCTKANIFQNSLDPSNYKEHKKYKELVEYLLSQSNDSETYFKKYFHEYFIKLFSFEDAEIELQMMQELDNFLTSIRILEEKDLEPIEKLSARARVESYLSAYSRTILKQEEYNLDQNVEEAIQNELMQNDDIGEQLREYTMDNIKLAKKIEGRELSDFLLLNRCKYAWMENIQIRREVKSLSIYPLISDEGIQTFIIHWKLLLEEYIADTSVPPEQNSDIINLVIKSANEGYKGRIGFLFAIIITTISVQIADSEGSVSELALLKAMFDKHHEIFKKFFKNELTKFVCYIIFDFSDRELLLRNLESEVLTHRKIFGISLLAVLVSFGGAGLENPLSSLFFKRGEIPAEISKSFNNMYPPGAEECTPISNIDMNFGNLDSGDWSELHMLSDESELSDITTNTRNSISGKINQIGRGYQANILPKESQKEEKARGIQSYLTYRALHLFVHISLRYFCSDRKQELAKIVLKNSDTYKDRNLIEIMCEHIDKDYELLEESLDIPVKSRIIWMYQLINMLPNILYNFQKAPTSIQIQRDFEKEFENHILPNIKDKDQAVKSYKKAYDLFEAKFITKDIPILPQYDTKLHLHRFRSANLEDLKQNYYASYQFEYPLVNFLLKNYERINKIQNLFPILTFTNYLIKMCSNKVSREEARANITMKNYLVQNPKARIIWDKFLIAWSGASFGPKLRFACTELDNREFSEEDSLINFLADDKEKGNGLYMVASLESLGQIYNELIADFQCFIPPQRIWKEKISLQGMKEENTIHLNNLDISTLAQEYNYVNLDNPTENNYQYEAISELVLRAFAGKKKVKLYEEKGFSTILYKGESSNKRIEKMREIIPQTDLSHTEFIIYEELFTEFKEIKGEESLWQIVFELMNGMEEIMTDITNKKAHPKSTLDEFLRLHQMEFAESLKYPAEAKNIKKRILSLKLENMVAFYEYLELKWYPYFRQKNDTGDHNDEQPQIENLFREFLREDAVKELLGELYIQKLGQMLRRFMIRNLKEEIDQLCPLYHYLDKADIWAGDLREEDRKIIMDKLPSQLMVKHAFHLVDYLNQQPINN